MIGETQVPPPAPSHHPARDDYTYVRNGGRNLFLFFEPRRGWRHVTVTAHRTKQDGAHCMQELGDVQYPDAERIRLVEDTLNTHTPAALAEVFAPAEAKRILDRLEFHHTPKQGSWLNMAEIELSVLTTPCLDRRIPAQTTLAREVAAWEHTRNTTSTTVDWRFTTDDARIKLKRLYPSIQS